MIPSTLEAWKRPPNFNFVSSLYEHYTSYDEPELVSNKRGGKKKISFG